MLAGTAQAIADSLSQFPQEFARSQADAPYGENQVYGHPLLNEPLIDGYLDDWSLSPDSVRKLRGTEGSIAYAVGIRANSLFLYVDARDTSVIYFQAGDGMPPYADQVILQSFDVSGGLIEYIFRTEAPGSLAAARRSNGQVSEETRIVAHWQDTASGYQLEATDSAQPAR